MVLIDCWEIDPDNKDLYQASQKLYHNILQTIPLIPDLAAVVLATYHSSEMLDPHMRNNRYYSNSYDMFFEKQPLMYIRQQYAASMLASDTHGHLKTDSSILNAIWPSQQFAMVAPWQLQMYINTIIPHVKNIWFMGMHWNMCIEDRPLGWETIAKMIKFNHLHKDTKLLARSDCILEDSNGSNVFPDLTNDQRCHCITDTVYEINHHE